MAAIIELKYFNSFILKKIEEVTEVVPGDNTTSLSAIDSSEKKLTIDSALAADKMNTGQQIKIVYTDIVPVTYISYITERLNDTEFTVNEIPNALALTERVEFGKIINFDNIQRDYSGNDSKDWLLEESRIRGGYNNTTVDFGVKAYLVEDEKKQSNKFSSLIHSGIFNSRTGVNQTNQFSVAEDTNLIIFQESKVSKSLIDKDAIYSAEGNASVTSRNLVIGQNVAYAGEYGISTDPESFAVNGYRKYFTDRDQNVVCRLSMDGITVISSYGMTDFFRDKLSTATSNIIGGWDAHNKQYVLSIPQPGVIGGIGVVEAYETLSFDETSKGWVSLFDYKPNQIFSLNNNYFTTKLGKIYKHYTLAPSTQARGVFYGAQKESSVTFVFNGAPSMIKNFQTINYEGDTGWRMTEFKTNTDNALPISQASFATTLAEMQNALLVNSFKLKEDKYYADLVNNTSSQNGEVLFGGSSSGIKGFFGEVTMTVNNSAGKKELFAVSTGFVKSS